MCCEATGDIREISPCFVQSVIQNMRHTHTHTRSTQTWNPTADLEICSQQSWTLAGGKQQCCVRSVWKRFSKVQPWTCGSLSLAVCPVLACDRERERERERERDKDTQGEREREGERDVVVGVWEIDEGIRECLYVRRCTCSLRRPIAKHTHFLSLSHTHTHTHTQSLLGHICLLE